MPPIADCDFHCLSRMPVTDVNDSEFVISYTIATVGRRVTIGLSVFVADKSDPFDVTAVKAGLLRLLIPLTGYACWH